MKPLLWIAILVLFTPTARAEITPIEEILGRVSESPAGEIVAAEAGDWPCWRGPRGDGIAEVQSLPDTFGPTDHLIWKVQPPGLGHAAPIVWKNQVLLAAADTETQEMLLVAYDRDSGRENWRTVLHRGGFAKSVHRVNSQASPTPCCDGKRILTVFIHQQRLWISGVNLDGNVAWQTDVGPYDAVYGYGSSPALHQSAVIVTADNDRVGAWMAAVNRETGKIIWRVRRPDIDTYATPIITRMADRPQLILGGSYTASYNPDDGKEVWRCDGPTAETTANSIAFSRDTVFVSGGYPLPYTLMAVRGDGTGDVTPKRLWQVTKKMPYVPSPLYHDGLLYIVDDKGVGSCLDSSNGKSVWAQRLPGGDASASPVLCGDCVYVAKEEGVVLVLKRGRQFGVLHETDFGERIMSTPTICGGRIYVRTARSLFVLGNR